MTDSTTTEARVGRRRGAGRPLGTDYRRVDAPLHQEMRRMYENGLVPTLTAAAWAVVDRAYGSGTQVSKVSRLVRTYRTYEE